MTESFDKAKLNPNLQENPYLYSMVNFLPLIKPLLDSLQPESVCEVGTYVGDMQDFLISYCRNKKAEYFGVDINLQAGLKKQPSDIKISFIEQDSLSYLKDSPVHDIYFIDTEHNYYIVLNELSLINNNIKNKTPLIFIHDVGWPTGRRDAYNSLNTRVPEEFIMPYRSNGFLHPTKNKISDKGPVKLDLNHSYATEEGGEKNGVLTAVEDFLSENKGWKFIMVPAIFGLGLIYKPEYMNAEAREKINELEIFCKVGHNFISSLEFNRFALLSEINSISNGFTSKLRSFNQPEEKYKFSVGQYIENEPDYWKKDLALQKVNNFLLASPECKYISFDCFDTLIKRLSPSPIHIFKEVGKRLQEKKLLLGHLSPDTFLYLRYNAESMAIKENKHTPLEQIYSFLDNVLLETNYAAEVEVEAEKDFCYLNLYVTDFIRYLKENSDYKIVIISDSFYSSEQITTILKAIGFNTTYIDKIFTSSEQFCSKYEEGTLYKKVLQSLEIKSSEIIHIGDNEKADFINAFLKGIQAFHYINNIDNMNKKLQVLHREKLLYRKSNVHASFDSLRTLVSSMDTHIPDDVKSYHEIGVFIFGPIFSRFSDWSLHAIRKKKIKQVFALMREGEVFGTLLKKSARALDFNIEVTPLYVSRQSTGLATFTEENPKKLFKLFKIMPKNISRNKILEIFSLEEIKDLYTSIYPADDMDKEILYTEQMQFAGNILKNKQLFEKTLAIATEQRDKLLKYLKPLLHTKDIALIDIGYGGTIQQNLSEIFRYEGIDINLYGYYFVSSINSVERYLKGLEMHFYLGHYGNNTLSTNSFIFSPLLLEEITNGCIGSTKTYIYTNDKQAAEPVFDKVYYPEDEIRKKNFLHQGIYDFHEYTLKIFQHKLDNTDEKVLEHILHEIDEFSVFILNRFISFPTQEEAALFAEFTDSNYRLRTEKSSAAVNFCDQSYFELYRRQNLDGLFNSDCQWPQGIAALANPVVIEQFFYLWETFNGFKRK